MMQSWPNKDPADRLDYAIDWSAALDTGDQVASATWSATAGLTVEAGPVAGAVTTVWLSGGTAGEEHRVTCHLATAEGREMNRSVRIKVIDR